MPAAPSHISIVHLLAPAAYGGLESVVETLAAGQAAAGDAVCVAVVLTGAASVGHPFVAALERKGVEVAVLDVGGRAYLEERRKVRDLLADRGADVLHTHGYRPDVVDAPVARRSGVATVTTVHGYTGGGWKNRIYEKLQTRAFRKFDAVIAVSAKLRRELVAAGVPDARVHAVRNAWASDPSLPSRSESREALGLPADGAIVGWVGRMSAEKAPDVMVRALAASGTPGLRLSMIGSGPLEEEARSLARSLGVADRVRWHGVVPQAGRHLNAFDLVALTSWTEGTPIVLLEAMAAGVPVVATSVGGVPDALGPDGGLLVRAGDPTAVAAALDGVLSDPVSALTRASRAGQRMRAELAVEPWVARHRRIYASVLAGGRLGHAGTSR